MDDQKFLNFLTDEFKEARESLESHEGYGEISKELTSNEVRYTNITQINEGAMKCISSVHDRITDRHLAMATLKNKEKEEAREHFLREARITASLQHPNIMPVHDIGFNSRNEPYFTMKLIEGKSFSEFLKESDNLVEKLNIFLKVCDGINYAHSQGIVHLDLKPDNVQVGQHGDVIVCDWGLAKVIYEDCNESFLLKDSLDAGSLQLTLYGRGTPGYMAPEQFMKEIDLTRSSDIYSLGAILYSILTDTSSVSGDSYEVIKQKTVSGTFQPPSLQAPNRNIPMGLEAVCMKAMSLKPEDRYNQVQELMDDVQAWLNGFAPKAENAGFITQLKLLYLRNKTIVILSSASLFLLIFGAVWFSNIVRDRDEKNRIANNKLQDEVKLRKEAEDTAFQKSVNEAWFHISQGDMKRASSELKKALKFNATHNRTLRLAAIVNLIQFKFQEAETYSSKLRGAEHESLRNRIREVNAAKSTPWVKVLEEFQNDYFSRVYNKMVQKIIAQMKTAEQRTFLRDLILMRNKKLSNEDIFISEDLKKIRINSKALRHIPPLKGTPVEEVDLSHSSIYRLYFLNGTAVKRLSIAYTNNSFVDLSLDTRAGLEDFNIEGTGYSHIPEKMKSLKVLNIAGCKIGDYSKVKDLTALTLLITNYNQIPDEDLSKLECAILEKDIAIDP